jgi:hypothetical protein
MDIERVEKVESTVNEEALIRMINKTRAFLRKEQQSACADGPAGFVDEAAAEVVLNYLKPLMPGQPGIGADALLEGARKDPRDEGWPPADPVAGVLGGESK